MKAKFALLLSLFLLVASTPSLAQVATGTPFLGSFTGGPDTINLGNLNVDWLFPLINKPGRGIPFVLAPTYNSSVWYPVTANGTTSWQPVSGYGWSGLPSGYDGYYTYQTPAPIGPFICGQPINGNSYYYEFFEQYYTNYVYYDTKGTSHTFGNLQTYTVYTGPNGCQSSPPPPSGMQTATAQDGSGYTIAAYPNGFATVTDRKGRALTFGTPSTGYQEDANGNYINCTSQSCTDTLGTTAMSVSGSQTAPPIVIMGPGGAEYKINYTNQTVRTHFQCSTVNDYGPVTVPLVSSIDLPDGRQYQIVYEDTPGYVGTAVTGRIKKITLPSDPSGPTIQYAYSGGNNGINCSDGSTPTLTRTTPDGQWTYARAQSGSTWITTVTAPAVNGASDVTKVAFGTSSGNFYEVGRQVYSGSSTLLETILTCYNTSTSGCPTTYAAAVAGPVVGSLAGTVVYTQFPNDQGITAGFINQYDIYGSLTESDTYDFNSGAIFSTNPIRINVATYELIQSLTDSTTGANIGAFERLQDEYTVDGYATPRKELTYTQYNYDETQTDPSGAPNKSAGLGCGYNCKSGNLTSVYKLVSKDTPISSLPLSSCGSGCLQSTFKNFDTGLVEYAYDVNTETATYAYNGSGGCADAFPTSTTWTTGNSAVPTLTTSATWNCDGGAPVNVVDVNSNTTTYGYSGDPYFRPTSITDHATGAVVSYSYPSSSSQTSSVSMNFNQGGSTSTSVTTYDALGRVVLKQTQQAPSSGNYDTVAISYDGKGRLNFQTLPYQGTLGEIVLSNPGTSTTYDGLDRPSQVTDGGGGTATYAYSKNDTLISIGPAPSGERLKKRSLEYNGAGWLTSVCELNQSTLPAGGSCGQKTTNTGYLTKYSYSSAGWLTGVSQDAQTGSPGVQSRSISYDGLGRKTSETIPEWSAGNGVAGGSAYTYDSDSSGTCSGTYEGDLVRVTDNIGNKTCFTYDLLHRILSSSVASGAYQSVTPASYYVYDAASYSGTAMKNAKGNLAEAYTCTAAGSCGTKLTDEYFSSSPVTGGVTSSTWQSTPNSHGYFLTQDTYLPNGAVQAISSTFGSSTTVVPSVTYGLDGEGRPYSATVGGTTLVQDASYYPGNLVSTVDYGNGSEIFGTQDQDQYSYDWNTNRLTEQDIWFGTQSPFVDIQTQLNWNPNGSLQQMVYTDGSDSTGNSNQTCNYSADDLGRVKSVSCGGAWAQTFAYDAFGNINKSGSLAYAATYTAATNQASLSGGYPKYDANGNVTYQASPSTNLSWNALNQPWNIQGTTATYDALGRMVETAADSTYKQFVFRPSGDLYAVYSGKLLKGTVPLPGGATAVYDNNGLSHIRHKDWLGSARVSTTWGHAVYSKVSYAPFGETYNEANGTGTAASDRGFTGQDQDVVTGSGGQGVYDFLFRKYDPAAGRWLSPDPAGWGAVSLTAPQSLNRYAYVANTPLTAVDGDGLCPEFTWAYVPDGNGGMTWQFWGSRDDGTPCKLGGGFVILGGLGISVAIGPGGSPFGGTNFGSSSSGGAGGGAPNNGTPQTPQQKQACYAQAQAVINGPPSLKPETQDYLDGIYAGTGTFLLSLATDGVGSLAAVGKVAGKTALGTAIGTFFTFTGRAMQKGLTYQAINAYCSGDNSYYYAHF